MRKAPICLSTKLAGGSLTNINASCLYDFSRISITKSFGLFTFFVRNLTCNSSESLFDARTFKFSKTRIATMAFFSDVYDIFDCILWCFWHQGAVFLSYIHFRRHLLG